MTPTEKRIALLWSENKNTDTIGRLLGLPECEVYNLNPLRLCKLYNALQTVGALQR